MDRVMVAACICLTLFTVGVQPTVAGPSGPPEDDYVDRDCFDARTIDPTNATVSGSIDYENDADTVRFGVEEGDTFTLRIVTGESAHEFTVGVHMLETEWTGRIKPGGNTRPWGRWDLAVVLNDSGSPGYARAFTVVDDTMCLTVHDDPPESDAYPVAWSLRIVENDVPGWYRGEAPPAESAPESTPTSTPTAAGTTSAANATSPTVTAATPASPTATPEAGSQDADGDGVPDAEDYAPRDARVQAVEDVRVVTGTPSSNALGPGVGPAGALVAVALLGLLARRR